ncbi:phage filamentation protein Fil family protein [Rahnella sp. BIGb0236]|uniref:phage filamentation protein Fil family protein n=1 Tax=Rahnella sp. BIGb0236 TaxID=2485117 RepID=UPI00105B3C64|nr:phage filamentation protein Fil family protein [Rahnella sp. BIGb0236]
MTVSIAPFLKQQSPSRHFGHGCIELPGGKRWNPSMSQATATQAVRNPKPLLKRLFS